jgi:hypothetical protein
MHGQPRGFKINISKVGQDPIVKTTSKNVTTFDNLQALTNYSLSVLAVNQIGDGPWSRRVYVKSLPESML